MRDGTAILFIKKIIIRLIDNCLDSCLRLLTKPCVFHLKVKNLGFFFCFDFRFRNFYSFR